MLTNIPIIKELPKNLGMGIGKSEPVLAPKNRIHISKDEIIEVLFKLVPSFLVVLSAVIVNCGFLSLHALRDLGIAFSVLYDIVAIYFAILFSKM